MTRVAKAAVLVGLLLAPAATAQADVKYSRYVELARDNPAQAMHRAIRQGVKEGQKPEVARIYAAVAIVNGLAPYGDEDHEGLEYSWQSTAHVPYLACDFYAYASVYLYRAGGGRAPARHLGFAGENGSPFNSHAEVQIGSRLMDPTIGVVADAPGLLQHRRVAPRNIHRVGYLHLADQTFDRMVIEALENGEYDAGQLAAPGYDFVTLPGDQLEMPTVPDGWHYKWHH